MNPFNQAWLLLKAPIYETGIPNINFVTQGPFPDPFWREEENVYGYVPDDPKGNAYGYYDEGNEVGEIQHMTPGEYGKMTTGEEKGGMYVDALGRKKSPRESDDTFYQELMDRAQAGENVKFGMPYVFPDFEPETYHDGRHRMAELFARGHGDTPLPVKVMRGTHG
ncbi:MAG: hypothetical protein CXT67_00350 [Methanobacteriota archaeon]|nr:MAG: hypothetical protein CXT67_00350 [Euryarchaeota archaeon]